MAINIFEEKTLIVFGFLNTSPMETAVDPVLGASYLSSVWEQSQFQDNLFPEKPSVTALGETHAIVTTNPVMVHPAAQAHPGTARSSPSTQPPSLQSWGEKMETVYLLSLGDGRGVMLLSSPKHSQSPGKL